MQETGPIYNVPLIDTLPLGSGGVLQQMPSRDDLQACSKRFMRVAAGYEVLLAHYQSLQNEIGSVLKQLEVIGEGADLWDYEDAFESCCASLQKLLPKDDSCATT